MGCNTARELHRKLVYIWIYVTFEMNSWVLNPLGILSIFFSSDPLYITVITQTQHGLLMKNLLDLL